MEWFISFKGESWTIYFLTIKDFVSELSELGKFLGEIESKSEQAFDMILNIGFTTTGFLLAAWQV